MTLPATGTATAPGASPLQRGLLRLRQGLRTAWRADALLLGLDGAGSDAAGLRALTLARFAEWCAAHPGSRCDLGLSARLMHACVAPAEAGPLARDDLLAYAERQFQHYFGHGEEQAFRVAASADARAAIACGADADWIDDLLATAREHGVRIARIRPWWAAGLHATLSRLQRDLAREGGTADVAGAASGLAVSTAGAVGSATTGGTDRPAGADGALTAAASTAAASTPTVALAAVEPAVVTFLVAEATRVRRLWSEPLAEGQATPAGVLALWRERGATRAPLWCLTVPGDAGLPGDPAQACPPATAFDVLAGRLPAEQVAA